MQKQHDIWHIDVFNKKNDTNLIFENEFSNIMVRNGRLIVLLSSQI